MIARPEVTERQRTIVEGWGPWRMPKPASRLSPVRSLNHRWLARRLPCAKAAKQRGEDWSRAEHELEGPLMFQPHDDPSRFLAAIVDSSEDAIIGKDLDGTIVSWTAGPSVSTATRRPR